MLNSDTIKIMAGGYVSINFLSFELFCSLYDQILKPSKFPANADFHLFKTGVEPKWEDPECANGGKWTVTSSRKDNLDTMWLETVNFFLSYYYCQC